MARTAAITRTTKETDIRLSLCLDGGEVHVSTGSVLRPYAHRPLPFMPASAWT